MIRVLLAEDDPGAASAVAAQLRIGGVAVDVARTAGEALVFAARQRYLATLADVTMFAEDELRALGRAAPLVLVSALPANALAALAGQLGARAWLEKPLALRPLEELLLDIARERQA